MQTENIFNIGSSLGEYKKCPICKKQYFKPAMLTGWGYKSADKKPRDVCSYSCMRESEKRHTPKKLRGEGLFDDNLNLNKRKPRKGSTI